jgi:lipopolysaccharide assembly protein A
VAARGIVIAESVVMRHVYMVLIALIAGIVLLFKVQNLDTVTVTLLSMNFSMPVSILVLLIYVLGMFTGGFMLQLVRTLMRGARAPSV